MREIAAVVPILTGKALERTERALAALREPKPFVVAEAQARVDAALSQVA